MISVRCSVLVALALGACNPAPERTPAPPTVAPAEAPADAAQPHSSAAEEYGIGLIHFDQAHHSPPRYDTLRLRTGPTERVPVVAHFVFAMPSGMEWAYEVSDSTGVIDGNVVEFGYEESGLPFDSITSDSMWVRTIYAAGPIRHGWTRRTDRTALLFWTEYLGERASFFLRDDFIALHASPGGPRIEFPLDAGSGYPSQYDYHLETDSVSGRWVRARVVSPSDACGIDAGPVRDTIAWVEYVNARGWPRVWYYSRGC